MALKSIRIENFKSIGEIEIVNPQPFSVLVGPNGAGKSNIFAALQFLHHANETRIPAVISAFGGEDILHYKSKLILEGKVYKKELIVCLESNLLNVQVEIGKYISSEVAWDYCIGQNLLSNYGLSSKPLDESERKALLSNPDFIHYTINYTRLFVGKREIVFQAINDDSKLAPDASNLEKVLKRILNDPEIKDEFIETLQLFVPGLDRVDVVSSEFSSNLDLLVYEKALKRPINKELISDGTYNIIAILTALYQSKTPQFLCIEEPENGLNPQVVKELVEICRYLCEQHGHYIWLNTHSQSLVSQLKPEEIILVDKVEGFTKIKQFKKGSFGKMPMDEAWLTNTLGGGLPW